MSNWLSKPVDAAKSTWNVVRSIGPFIVSQADSTSEAFARHQARLAAVEAGKELLFQEIQTHSNVKKLLLERFIAADAEERIRIRRDLNEIDGSLRQLNVGTKALNYIPAPSAEPPPASPDQQTQPEVTSHWMDKFSELARAHNESWREDLLSRALAKESSAPGTVSPRALWLLGTLEERSFDSFAILLDLASSIAGRLMIPKYTKFLDRPIPQCALGDNVAIGNLIFQLDEVGLFANTLSSSRTVVKGQRFLASYGSSAVFIDCVGADLSIPGIIPTGLGASLASFYEPKSNPLGKEIFEAWVESLDRTQFPVEEAAG